MFLEKKVGKNIENIYKMPQQFWEYAWAEG